MSTWTDPHAGEDPYQRAARTAAEGHLGCARVQVWGAGTSLYRVTGCGRYALYTCQPYRRRISCGQIVEARIETSQASGDEQDCVAAVIGELRAIGARTPGSLLHALHE